MMLMMLLSGLSVSSGSVKNVRILSKFPKVASTSASSLPETTVRMGPTSRTQLFNFLLDAPERGSTSRAIVTGVAGSFCFPDL